MLVRVLALTLAATLGSAAVGQTAPLPPQPPQMSTQMPAQMPAQPMMTSSDGYQLGINDEIEVTIFGQGQQGQVTKTRVKEDGTITLPLIGSVIVRDMTARQVAEGLTEQLRTSGFFTKPVVSVDVTQYVSNSVTIYGAVGSSGVFPLDRSQNVAMMIARAGGARSDGADYVILRRADGSEHRIPLASFTGEFSGMTSMRAGDTLFVPPAPVIFVYGQVNSPGSFPIKSNMTIRQVLARAGGPTLAGSERNISIYRGGERLRKVDLNSLAQDGDTLFIHERIL